MLFCEFVLLLETKTAVFPGTLTKAFGSGCPEKKYFGLKFVRHRERYYEIILLLLFPTLTVYSILIYLLNCNASGIDGSPS